MMGLLSLSSNPIQKRKKNNYEDEEHEQNKSANGLIYIEHIELNVSNGLCFSKFYVFMELDVLWFTKFFDCFFGLSEKESWKERRRKPCVVVVG